MNLLHATSEGAVTGAGSVSCQSHEWRSSAQAPGGFVQRPHGVRSWGRLRWPQCLLDCWLVHSCFLEKNSVPLTLDPSSFTILRSHLSPFPSGCGFEGQAVHGWSQEMEDRSCQTRFPKLQSLEASSQSLACPCPSY